MSVYCIILFDVVPRAGDVSLAAGLIDLCVLYGSLPVVTLGNYG
ncbi:hypothetical protein ACFSOV_22105 [Pedobacter petrophilus]|nr:hypothetical protein [Pedobacter petrophilus]